MIRNIKDCVVLNNGVHMPSFGLGTYKMTHSQETNDAVKVAMKHGYRLIDTASFYDNEEEIGTAIEESGMKREDIFVTTKVWNSEQGYDETIKAFERSRKKLGIEYIDLYLIHWPVPGKYIDTWKALEKLYKDGSVRAIGVCNFHIHHLQDIMENSEVVPVVNQVEYHPYLQQPELHSFCKEHNIFIEAWAPLMRGKVFDNSIIQGLSMKYNKTPAQITLRWEIQNEIITIPKSSNERRIIENANIYDFNLTEEEMKQMANLDKNERTGYDPDKFPYDKM